MIRTLRLYSSLLCILMLTLVCAPVQWCALKLHMQWVYARLPIFYLRGLLWILGVRLKVDGQFTRGAPILLVSNHVSWIDIVALGAIAPLSFIAKSEIASWPVFGMLAKLQRTVFVDRARKMETKNIGATMEGRFAAGEALVLFAEGTTGTGARVLPFKSALIGAALLAGGKNVAIQPVTITYTHWHGLPIGQQERPFLSWYGDMDMLSHVAYVLQQGGIDMRITIHPPMPQALVENRKALTLEIERVVKQCDVE